MYWNGEGTLQVLTGSLLFQSDRFTYEGARVSGKVLIMQGKFLAVEYTLRTYRNQFSLGGLCKQESVQYPQHLILIILKIHIIVFYDQNIL